MKRRPIFASAVLVLGIALALLVFLTAFAQQDVDGEETLREQAAALAAETEEASPRPFNGLTFPAADYPLFIGVDNLNVPTYRMDPATGISVTAFLGSEIWGAAYDDVNDRILFNDGTTLYEWPIGGSVNLLGTITDPSASPQSMVGLAFYNGELYGTKNVSNEAVWKIDTSTLVATVYIDYVDADVDAGGLAIDPLTGEIYATNDDATPYGRSVIRINPNASVDVIAAYPSGETDIDGLAIGNGTAYLITDEPGVVYSLDLSNGTYGPTFPNPWTSAEVFAGGAWIAPSGPAVYCSAPAVPIPDNDPAGVSDSLVLTDTLTIEDIDVYLDTSHTWVADLVYTITHQDTGTFAVIYDRPGVPATTFGCSGDDIDATLDDEASTPVENECGAGVPSIQGSFIPNNPLSAFDGESLVGTWTLNVSDNASGDTGTLNSWCLSSGPEMSDPVIHVDPASMGSTQLPNAVVTQTLTISNSGGSPLVWSIFEDGTSAPAAVPAPGPAEKLGAPVAAVEYSPKAIALLESPVADVVQDGGFETGTPNAFWTEFSTNFGSPLCTAAACGTGGGTGPHSGTWWSWFGGITGIYENGTVSQDVTIGSTGTATLSFWVEQPVCDGTAGDYLEVTMDGAQLWMTDATDPNCGVIGYRQVSLDVSSYADGGTHTLVFNSETFSGGAGPTNFFVDDVSLDDSAAVACSAPSDIPWASASPAAGITYGGSTSDVVVTFDSTGLQEGSYSGSLCVDSNDPVTPQVAVPVDLIVLPTPDIDVSPASLSATLAANGMEDQTLTIANTGSATLNWSIFEDNTVVSLPSFSPAVPNTPATVVDLFDPDAVVVSAAARPSDWEAPANVLYDNGPLVNSSGTGVGGVDESVLQSTSLSMNTYGFGHQVLNNNWVADDFTIPDAEGWTVDSITYFAYQTGSSTTSTMTNVNWLLYDGDPSAGGSVIASGSGLDSSVWANIYRVSEATTGSATDRPIMANTLNLGGTFLPQGTYWLAWQTDGTLASGPWAPPVTINGQATTGNGLQSLGGTTSWAAAIDVGSNTQQGFPFMIEGIVGTPPCMAPSDIPWLSVSPDAGSTGLGSSSDVTVTFDAAGLSLGTYSASLCVLSDDPDEPIVVVPVTLDVTDYKLWLPIIMHMP